MKSEQVIKSSCFNPGAKGLREYMFMINPEESINEMVMQEKRDFFTKYGAAIAVNTKPHIAVANFVGRDEMEYTLIGWIQKICSMQKGFPVTLNNYSSFPLHTIYLRVQDPEPLLSFAKKLKVINEFIQCSSCAPLQLTSKPHLILAGKLTKEIYEKASRDYAQKDFHESFMVNELVLLKRDHHYDTCKLVNVFRLNE